MFTIGQPDIQASDISLYPAQEPGYGITQNSIGFYLNLAAGSSIDLYIATQYGPGLQTASISSSGTSGPELLYGPTSQVPVPEPATLLLIGSGLIGLAGIRRIRQNQNKNST